MAWPWPSASSSCRCRCSVWVGPVPARASGAGMLLMDAASLAAVAPGSQTGPRDPIDLLEPDAVPPDLDATIQGWLDARDRVADLSHQNEAMPGAQAEQYGFADLDASSVVELLNKADGHDGPDRRRSVGAAHAGRHDRRRRERRDRGADPVHRARHPRARRPRGRDAVDGLFPVGVRPRVHRLRDHAAGLRVRGVRGGLPDRARRLRAHGRGAVVAVVRGDAGGDRGDGARRADAAVRRPDLRRARAVRGGVLPRVRRGRRGDQDLSRG